MEQLSNNIIVITVGEQVPDEAREAIKIYLAGSVDFSEDNKFDWQGIFCKGLAALTDPKEGQIMWKDQKYVIINPKARAQNPEASIQNEEFVNKLNWTTTMMEQADVVLINFLKKSQAVIPMVEFGMLLTSEKLVVRCPEEYQNYPIVRTLCEKYNVPLYPGSVSATRELVQGMYAHIPRMQELSKANKHKLPE